MSTAEWLTLLLAAFSAGGTVMWTHLKVESAILIARRAHARIDELESQTGTHTVLREDSTGR